MPTSTPTWSSGLTSSPDGGGAAGITMDRLALRALRAQINPHAFLGIEESGHALGAALFEPEAAIDAADAAIEPAEDIIARHAAQLDLAAAPVAESARSGTARESGSSVWRIARKSPCAAARAGLGKGVVADSHSDAQAVRHRRARPGRASRHSGADAVSASSASAGKSKFTRHPSRHGHSPGASSPSDPRSAACRPR